MSTAYERIVDALSTHGSKSRDVRQNHSMWQCPAHPDNNPSLGVDDAGDRVMIRCYAGCHVDDVIKELGLELRDLFDESTNTESLQGSLVRSYLYERPNGEPWFYVDRFWPKDFRQRLPGVEPVRSLANREDCKRLGLKGRKPILYHVPRVARALRKGDATVWLLDGEKDVETAERHGLVATCPPGFAKGWREEYGTFLKDAKRVVIVVDQDKEKPDGRLGSGQEFATAARQGLRALGVPVDVLAPAVGKDLTDHFDGGYGVDDFRWDVSVFTRPRGMKAKELMHTEFPDLLMAVDPILPAGVTIFAGSPKAGKSWLALDLCLAIASGGMALSSIRVEQGSVIYLAREDTYRRLQSRIALLNGGDMEAPAALELVPQEQEWVGGAEGLADLTEWAEEVRDPRLVVVDTIAKVEPDMGESRTRGAYAGNYSMMARYKVWAERYNCAVLMVHHDRKAEAGKDGNASSDPFTKISGTRGLTGAADTLWFLETVRGEARGMLHVTGRDVEEDTYELIKSGPLWRAML